MTQFSSYIPAAKNALTKKKKSTDSRGLNTKHNYSSFWMDDKWDNDSKFSGISGCNLSASNDTVKLIKLTNYRRAITNFVKIVTKQDIPVTWAGNQSYTNGKSVCLSADIKDSNFDVTVGLALHEASHIILTDFSILTDMNHGNCQSLNDLYNRQSNLDKHRTRRLVQDLLNWIEDRRIDHYVFSTSPGYKAYYHKLYDYYWNSNVIIKGLLSAEYSEVGDVNSYLFHIINMMNPAFNTKALPHLDEIVNLVDLQNISRIKNTNESLTIACEIAAIIMDEYTKKQEEELENNEDDKDEEPNNNGSGEDQADVNEDEELNDKGEDKGEDGDDAPEPLNSSEIAAIAKAFAEQKDFMNGKVDKKIATKNLQKQLDNIANQAIDVQTVGDRSIGVRTALLYDYTKGSKLQIAKGLADQLSELKDVSKHTLSFDDRVKHDNRVRAIEDEYDKIIDDKIFTSRSSRYGDEIRFGLDMGALLGKKLQLHNESRERVDTRLRSGKIDAKRLAHAGYGIEGIFKQVNIDRHKRANIHISLDGSGSMSGDKWGSVVKMTSAIAKAVTYAQNIDIQVSIRVTKNSGGGSDVPCNIMVYDSRKNKIGQLVAAFSLFNPNSFTPEGLCFEAMLRKDLLVPTSSEVDSYLLNLSDGEPGCANYDGHSAIEHTRRQVEKIKNELNISVLSFFLSGDSSDIVALTERFIISGSGENFRRMYGKDATIVDASNTMQIAKELNKKFLSK
jgi:hypothetical protein